LIESLEGKDAKAAKKSDGSKAVSVRVPKLADAALAGTRDSGKCTLILTEGDSAKTMALSGLSSAQRQIFGVFPLRGKLINPKEAAIARVHANAEVEALKKILGLRTGASYSDAGSLRYGSVLLMTDQDLDGSHIRGLLLNLFDGLWSSLLHVPGFLRFMSTPIVRVVTGPEMGRVFYTLKEHRVWASEIALSSTAASVPRVKYYKGLGTSSAAEAKGYFAAPRTVPFSCSPECSSALAMAFDPSKAAQRKAWLTTAYNADAEALPSDGVLAIKDFVHGDLVHFSRYNLQRAIPSVLDGLKISQRKIIFSCFKRRLTSGELRVAQLAGYVSEHAAYHHGEASMCATITGMAQGFVGANNVPLLEPLGQFGSRLSGGDDAASARYIYTRLSVAARALFPAADEDVLQYLSEEGESIEPIVYAPILPLVLLNGAEGIGTGFSTSVPSFNSLEVLHRVRARVSCEAVSDSAWTPVPFIAGFVGTVAKEECGDWVSTGLFTRSCQSALQVHISELPVGMWTTPYLEFLDGLVDKSTLQKYEDASTDTRVSITLHFTATLPPPIDDAALIKLLKLSKKIGSSNMHLLDADGGVRRYTSPSEILEAFLPHRMAMYETRKKYQLEHLNNALIKAQAEARFIELQLQGKLDLRGREENDICATLRDIWALPVLGGGYDYLLKMPLRSLTATHAKALHTESEQLQSEVRCLEETTATSMWLKDLSALETVFLASNSLLALNLNTKAAAVLKKEGIKKRQRNI
jgi:DNA topoisomerase-2